MAEPESTEAYFKRLAHKNVDSAAIRPLGKTEFRVSSIGFGGYRIHDNSVEHARALRYALLNGFNLIDTSSNYTDGGSERLIGNILQEMFSRRELKREEVVVVSKVGYVQGQNLKIAQENEYHGRPFADMVKYMDGCWHCIHPDFLQDQLSRTLERLQIPALDVYLLHNPEYFLSHQKKQNGMDANAAREVYYDRIKRAFEWMEEKVAEGKIKAYGISSNTFPNAPGDYEFTSLERVLQAAQYVASHNYFSVIQFPFNLFETGACFEKNQADGEKTLLQLARKHNIGTLVNRPLNAMTETGMVRLASFREVDSQRLEIAFDESIKTVGKLENQFKENWLEKLAEFEVPKENLVTVFSVSKQLSNAFKAFQGWEHWDHVKQNMLLPQVFTYLNYFKHKLEKNDAWQDWSGKYAKAVLEFADIISQHYETRAQTRSRNLSEQLDSLAPDLAANDTLSQKALRVLTSTSGVDCVLLGMRKTPYVEDALKVLQQPTIEEAEQTLKNQKA